MFAESGAAIYTLGAGDLYVERIARWLEMREVRYLIDVRTGPFEFKRAELMPESFAPFLKARGTTYLNLAEQLGDRPKDVSLQAGTNVIDYRKYRQRPSAKAGLDRIIRAWQMGCRVCVLGRTPDPVKSHRARLIGHALFERADLDVSVRHIVHYGCKIMTHEELLQHLWLARASIHRSYSLSP